MFSSFGLDEPTQVRADVGAPIRSIMLGVTGVLVALGVGEAPGFGTCECFWVSDDEQEVPEGTVGARRCVRGGTGDLQLRMPDGALTWFSGAHCRPWVAEDGLLPAGLKAGMPPPLAPAAPELLPHPPSPVPADSTIAESPTTLAAPTAVAEPTTEMEFEAARLERQLKHEQMRAHLRWLVASDARFKNQGALADELQFARPSLTQYTTGKSQHGVLRPSQAHARGGGGAARDRSHRGVAAHVVRKEAA